MPKMWEMRIKSFPLFLRKYIRLQIAPLGNALIIAARTLWAHKLRSFLTVFGIVVGIAAVVLIGATLNVIRDVAAKSTAQTIGANSFVIAQTASTGNLNRKELSDKLRKNPEIYRREAESYVRRIRETARAAPGLTSLADVKANNKTFLSATVNGSTADIPIIRNIELSAGRFFTDAESRRAAPVAIIGQQLADELFPGRDPLGKRVRIRGASFAVIGIQKKQGTSFGSSLDRTVYVPLTAFEKIWGSRRSVTLYLQPLDPERLTESMEIARMTMRLLRRLKPGAADNFDLLIPEAGHDFLSRIIGIVGIAIISISSVALFVAGIVVMNMMLVSVTERTQEIGIRKSMGARNRDIFAEILFESAILTMIGGIAGLAVSFIGAIGLSGLFQADVAISPFYALAAFSVSTIIGCGAGWFPAWVASRMPPVEALRYEN
jgi:putative ABC transport system permease protein